MNANKNQMIILGLTSWIVFLLALMVMFSTINLEILFNLWVVGLLATIMLADSTFLQAKYMKNIKILSATGVLIFGAIFLFNILEIIIS